MTTPVARLTRGLAAVATAGLAVGLLAGAPAAASTPARPGPGPSCAVRLTSAAAAFAAARHMAASARQGVIGAARDLCAGAGRSGAAHAAVSANRLELSAAAATTPASSCAASVSGQMRGSSRPDIAAAIADLCTTEVTFGLDVTSAPAPSARPAVASKGFPGPWPVYQTAAWEQQCSKVSCALWKERIRQLYFWNGVWGWHHLAHYTWSYVNCNDNDGSGFTVTVNSCYWAGPNPDERFGPRMTANVQYHVSFIVHGSPVSVYHCMYMGDPATGHVRFHTCDKS